VKPKPNEVSNCSTTLSATLLLGNNMRLRLRFAKVCQSLCDSRWSSEQLVANPPGDRK
jgi:hypothetical protein